MSNRTSIAGAVVLGSMALVPLTSPLAAQDAALSGETPAATAPASDLAPASTAPSAEPHGATTDGLAPSETPTESAADAPAGDVAITSGADTDLVTTSDAPPASPHQPRVTLGGYVEGFVQWNANEPSNGITHLRGFDNRHATFTLANVALDARFDYEGVVGRVALQVGHTPSTYYLAETSAPGASGTSGSDAELWKYVQQAYAGYRFSGGEEANLGLFLSPIGPESIAIRDNWNWSRSNLFFGLPFYHTGLRVAVPVGGGWVLNGAVVNGWNTVLDNNIEKSVLAQVTYGASDLALSVLYFGGIERPTGAPEGRAWRHVFDAHVTWHATSWLSFLAHANGGFEPNDFGTSSWEAGALYARVRILPELFVAARGDVFVEQVAANARGRASAIFWPSEWMSSGTLTVDLRPHPDVSVRAEYRHDHAAGDSFFGGTVMGDGITTPYLPNRRAQDTFTLGVTAGF